jgi:hypothetical protein
MSMRSFVDDEERFSHSKDIRPLTRAATRPRSYTATVYEGPAAPVPPAARLQAQSLLIDMKRVPFYHHFRILLNLG